MKKPALILLTALLALGFAACDPLHSETLYIVNRTGEVLTFEMDCPHEARGRLFPWTDENWAVDTLFSEGDSLLLRCSHPLPQSDTVTFILGGIGEICQSCALGELEWSTSRIGLRERILKKDLFDPLNWEADERPDRLGGGSGFYTFSINPEDVE